MNKLTKLFALLLVVALASTTFYVGTQLNSAVSTLGDEQNVSPVDLESSLEFDPLHVSIEGESKLHVNESSTYQAVVSGGSGNFGYLWSVDPVDEKVVFEYSGGTCGFMFVVATVDPYTLSVEVTDLVSGDKVFDSFTVYDPYTLPDLYLEASLANFVCRVKSDGTGWYFVSDGESGKTVFSSTVLLDAIDYALASTTSGNVLLDGVYFDYSLDIPVGISVTECVDGLTRVFVNEANSQGSPYTISVDTVQSGYYLSQDCMGRIINDFTSTLALSVITDTISITSTGEINFLKGTYSLGSTLSNIINIVDKNMLRLSAEKGTILEKTDNRIMYIQNCEDLVIEGFTFYFTTHENANALYFDGINNNIHIYDNIFDIAAGAVVSAADLIYFYDSDTQQTNGLYIENNIIYNSDLDAMSLHGVSNAWVQKNNILSFGTAALQAHGILVADSGGVTTPSNIHISQNHITGSASAGLKIGIGCHDYTTKIYVTENIINNTCIGIGMWENVGNCEIISNNINQNKIANTAEYIGISLVGVDSDNYGSKNIISKNIILNTGSYGVLLQYIDDSEVSSNQIDTTYDNAFVLAYVTNIRVFSNSIQNAANYGLQIYQSNSNLVTQNKINSSSSVGLYVNTANWNQILSNEITYSTDQGIFLTGASDSNIVEQNQCLHNTGTGISLWNGDPFVLTNNIIQYNILLDNTGGSLYDGATDTIIQYNVGFVTENSGSSVGTGAQQTVIHGLAGIPVVVLLSPPNSNAVQSAAADANNIYVTADIGETWYWYAIYKP